MKYSLEQSMEKVAAERKWQRKLSAEGLMNGWRSFVKQCEKGYSMNIYEYENDLYVRTMIQEVLSISDQIDDPLLNEFSSSVSEVDRRFRNVLQVGVLIGTDQDHWWSRGVPIFAGEELAADFGQIYGVAVAAV